MSLDPVTVCYLLRHSESAAMADRHESEWPLTQRGRRQAQGIAASLGRLGIQRVYSSPYRRALDTVRPFAERAGLQVAVLEDLRERKLSEKPTADFAEVTRRAWEDFAFALPGCESSAACQRRVVAAVMQVVRQSPASVVVLSSHGNAIGLLLNALLGTLFGFEQWAAMPRPALYRVEGRDDELELDEHFEWDPGVDLA
jgi:2,3-bisphosphoglycerate-dependent phosphoglycerate mutase